MKKIISSQKYSMYSLIFGKDFVKKQNERTNKTLIALLIVFVILNILGYKHYFFSIVAYIVATLTCVTLILTNNYLMTKFLSNSVKDYKSNFITWNFNYDSPILIKIWLKRAYNQFVKDEFKEKHLKYSLIYYKLQQEKIKDVNINNFFQWISIVFIFFSLD